MVERWLNDGRTMVEMPVLVGCKRGAVFFWQNKTPTSFGRRGRVLLLLGKNCHLSSCVLTFAFPVLLSPLQGSVFWWPDQGFRCASPLPVVPSPLRGFRSPLSVLSSQFSVLDTDDNTDADVVGLFRAKGKLACGNALIIGRLKKRTTTQDTTLQVGVGRPLRALGVNLRI